MTALALYSPSGVVTQPATLRRAAKRLGALGFDVSIDADALARHQRFAGDDATRLAAIHRIAAAAPPIAMATRGGYGLTRLLDGIDWKRIAKSAERGTRWVGHSDFTALQLAALAHGGVATWAGPMACYDFGRADSKSATPSALSSRRAAHALAAAGRRTEEHGEKLVAAVDDVTRDCFVEAMAGVLQAVGFRTEAGFDGLQVRGTLWGGNLAVLQSLLGTPHWPTVKGGVLFVEDVNEHPYRIERMLLQLQQAGVLDAQRAVLLGHLNEWKPSPFDRGYALKPMIAAVRAATKTPLLTGLPFGHVPTKVTLPVGARVQLLVDRRDVLIGW
jgi:muramoyltetrapeptide carboxypeptidase